MDTMQNEAVMRKTRFAASQRPRQPRTGRGARRTNKGFTLIELMIVVAIIAIIAAIAIPSLLRYRIQTNEAAAIENLRTLNAAQISYHACRNTFGGFDTLTSDSDGAGTAYLDSTWVEGGQRQGYVYSMASATAIDFLCYADPATLGTSGTRYFRVDASGIIRWSYTGRPSETDPAIGETL